MTDGLTADLTSLTLVSIGSAPLAPTVHRSMAERLPQATVTNNYSMTEAGSAFTFMPPGALDTHEGSVGMVMPPTEIRIADDDGEPLPAGEVGEVLIKVGEHQREYYLDPEATARTWTGEWLRSGDLGMLDGDGLPLHRGTPEGHRDPRRQQHRRDRGRERALRARRRPGGRGRRRAPRGARRGRRRVRRRPCRPRRSTRTS